MMACALSSIHQPVCELPYGQEDPHMGRSQAPGAQPSHRHGALIDHHIDCVQSWFAPTVVLFLRSHASQRTDWCSHVARTTRWSSSTCVAWPSSKSTSIADLWHQHLAQHHAEMRRLPWEHWAVDRPSGLSEQPRADIISPATARATTPSQWDQTPVVSSCLMSRGATLIGV